MNKQFLTCLTALVLTGSLSPLAQAKNYKYKRVDGLWSRSASWTPSGVPNSVEDGVFHDDAGNETKVNTVDSDTNYTINGFALFQKGNNHLTIDAGNPSSSLTLQTTNAPATIYLQNDGANHTRLTFNVNVILSNDLQVVIKASSPNKNKRILFSADITGVGNILSTVQYKDTGVFNSFANVRNVGSFTLGTSDTSIATVAGKTISAGLSNNGTTRVTGVLACTEGVFVTSGTLNLTGANTYTGGTSITGGRINVYNDGTLGKGDVTVGEFGTLNIQTNGVFADTAVLTVALAASPNIILDAGVNDTVGSLILDGTTYTRSGTYGSSTSDATHVFNDYFTGRGMLALDASRAATQVILR